MAAINTIQHGLVRGVETGPADDLGKAIDIGPT